MKLDLFYKTNEWLAVTIAPDDKLQFFNKPDRLVKFVNLFNERFLAYTQYGIEYIFYVELSEPHCDKGTDSRGKIYDKGVTGDGPRLHLHGKIRFFNDKSIRWWLLYGMHQLLIHTMITIKPIEDLEIWDKYCKKQQHVVRHAPLENILTT